MVDKEGRLMESVSKDKVIQSRLVNAVFVAIQKGLVDMLGKSATAMNTRLIRDLGTEIISMLQEDVQFGDITNLTSNIEQVLKEQLNLVEKVEYSVEEGDVTRYHFKIYGCVFEPTARAMAKYKSKPVICPIGLIIGSIIKEAVKDKQMRVLTNPKEGDSPCEITIELR